MIATTDQPEQFDAAVYRRFVERGLVIDIGELWEEPANLREVVRMELRRKNFSFAATAGDAGSRVLPENVLAETVQKLYPIFRERSLRITPAYVRRLIDSILTLREEFSAACLRNNFV